ncbi:MAG: hypothetical protein PXY39_11860 [archaeon]|nr:hypothetical protein [archaeon]
MPKAGINFVTATYTLHKNNDSRIQIPDGDLFRYVVEKKYKLVHREGADDYALITSDEELKKYCQVFGIVCKYVEKRLTRKDFKEMATKKLIDQLKSQDIR